MVEDSKSRALRPSLSGWFSGIRRPRRPSLFNYIRRSSNRIFGITLSTLTMRDIVDRLLLQPHSGMGVRLVATANLDHVVTLRKDTLFRESYRRAWLVTADGAPIFAYARLLGIPVQERVTGADLINELAEKLSPGLHRLFFVTSTVQVARCTEAKFLKKGFQAGEIVCVVARRGLQPDQALGDELAQMIERHAPTHLIIAIGACQGQSWLMHCGELGDLYALCVGAALEFHLGLKPRAPRWLRLAGLEWLWRVALEPRRLASRYFVASWGFLPAIIADLSTRGERPTLRPRGRAGFGTQKGVKSG
jgi:N-acetylglucosaminyldiphosphoundecaprenol N-acetyl-beta-D-mannosaminyltransferase